MVDEEDAAAGFRDTTDVVTQLLALVGVEAGCGLVEQSGAGYEPGRRGSIDSFAAEALASGYGPGRCAMAALHLMGSVRMGGDRATSALDPDGATWEVPNLVVADASTFPTASGVNPMVSVQAIAHMNATRLAARLG